MSLRNDVECSIEKLPENYPSGWNLKSQSKTEGGIKTPLTIRLALPAYSNDIISLLKSTALASTITIVDMTGIARTIVAETYAPYEIFISLAIVYTIFTWSLQSVFGVIESHFGRYTKREA